MERRTGQKITAAFCFNGNFLPVFFAVCSLVVFITTGCMKKHQDVFYLADNYDDEDCIKKGLLEFERAINMRDLETMLRHIDPDFNRPDPVEPRRVHTYRSLLYDYRDFFNRVHALKYSFRNWYMELNDREACVTMTLDRYWATKLPFNHEVRESVEERIQFKKKEEKWYITGWRNLWPPVIRDTSEVATESILY